MQHRATIDIQRGALKIGFAYASNGNRKEDRLDTRADEFVWSIGTSSVLGFNLAVPDQCRESTA
jgi:hypothetical protein